MFVGFSNHFKLVPGMDNIGGSPCESLRCRHPGHRNPGSYSVHLHSRVPAEVSADGSSINRKGRCEYPNHMNHDIFEDDSKQK